MPDADEMTKFQQLVPDAPERFFKMVEAQTVAPQERYNKLVSAEIHEARAGRISAVTLMVIFFAASVVFFAVGNNWAGSALLSVPVLGFLQSLLPSRAPRERRRDASDRGDEG